MRDESNLVSRGWLLLLLEAAERAGHIPVQMKYLHRFVYLANVLSPVCELNMPDAFTLKHMRGPYFPDVQWELGRLVIQKLIDVENVNPYKDKYGFWLDADYRISPNGIQLVHKLMRHNTFKELAVFLREFLRACSDLTSEQIQLISDHDLHYHDIAMDEGVNFDFPDNNIAKKAIVLMFPEDRIVTPREGVHRYITYLHLLAESKAS